MRAIKLPTLAELTNYNAGPANGQPTKIVPPVNYTDNGKIPLDAFGAQWQNYIENALQQQVERSAQLPFRNFVEVAAVPAITSPPRFAFNKYVGATLIANGVNNSIKYIQEFLEPTGGAPQGITVAPSSGTFVPKDVCSLDNIPAAAGKSWVVVGNNATATTATVWEIDRSASHIEQTMPVAGSLENVCRDPVTGKVFAFSASTNRAIFVRDTVGSWTLLGNRGAGAVAPAAGVSFCHANNGTLALIYQNGADTYVDKINTTSFSVTTTLVRATSAPCDIRWSDALGLWMLLTTKNSYTSSSLTSFTTVNTQVAKQPMPFSIDGGCLHPTGVVAWSNGSTGWGLSGAGYLYVQDWIDNPPHVMNFGTFPSNSGRTGYTAQFDGSAIWFMIDTSGTKRLFRSIRL